MRDGNQVESQQVEVKHEGFSLPMRDGNLIKYPQALQNFPGFSLPMRDGNSYQIRITVLSIWVLAYL